MTLYNLDGHSLRYLHLYLQMPVSTPHASLLPGLKNSQGYAHLPLLQTRSSEQSFSLEQDAPGDVSDNINERPDLDLPAQCPAHEQVPELGDPVEDGELEAEEPVLPAALVVVFRVVAGGVEPDEVAAGDEAPLPPPMRWMSLSPRDEILLSNWVAESASHAALAPGTASVPVNAM
jgi:hypothetical protein